MSRTAPRVAPAPVAARQLSLGLPHGLPEVGIEADWGSQPRLWGHSLHPLCSYLASFPAALAHAFVARYSRPGDVVLDPFAGRGTTPLQAIVEGRIGVGNDLNPLAHLLTAAKVEPATRAEHATRLAVLRLAHRRGEGEWTDLGRTVAADPGAGGVLVPSAGSGLGPDAGTEPVPAEVALAFDPWTLGQVLALRSQLDLTDRTDRSLAAALAGILHGKTAGYLTTLMPNTFSMAPGYVRRFAATTGYEAPRRDAFALLEAKLARLHRDPLPTTPGLALAGDARDVGARAPEALRARGLPERTRLVVTSPPYLRVLKYGYYNWLRTWLLGFDSRAIDAALDDAHRRAPYLAFMAEVLGGLHEALADDAVVVLVIGDVETDRGRRSADGLGLAEAVWEEAARPGGYALVGIVRDPVAPSRKVTRVWGKEAGRATATDAILVLGASEIGRRRALAGAPVPVDWTWPPRGPRVA